MSEPRFRVHDAGIEGSDAFLERWGASLEGFQDDGCGCCVHLLSFIGPEAAILELEGRFNQRIWREAVA